MASSSFQCRKSFNFDKLAKEIYQWFPGHMAKGLRQMYEQLPNVDAVIEVHDARAPFTGRNLAFRRSIIGAKPYAYVLNKADLADLGERERIVAKLAEESYAPCYFTVLRDSNDKAVRDILPNLVKQIDSQLRFNRELETHYHLLVVGVPNVGKSTLINRLRNFHLKQGNAVKSGADPGITRNVQSKVKINHSPLVYMFDTPGILEPTFDDIETGFKLACLNCVKNHAVNANILADYILYKMNKSGNFKYVEFYELPEPSDNIMDVLLHIAKKHKKIIVSGGFGNRPERVYDIDGTGHMMVKHFFDGRLGKSMLDADHPALLDDNPDDHFDKTLELDKFV